MPVPALLIPFLPELGAAVTAIIGLITGATVGQAVINEAKKGGQAADSLPEQKPKATGDCPPGYGHNSGDAAPDQSGEPPLDDKPKEPKDPKEPGGKKPDPAVLAARAARRAAALELLREREEDPDDKDRIPRENGHWEPADSPGNGDWYSDLPEVNEATGGRPIRFSNGYMQPQQFSIKTVEIDMTGDYNVDRRAADLAGDYDADNPRPPGYVWHHMEDGVTMELIPSAINRKIPHRGGAEIARVLRSRGQ